MNTLGVLALLAAFMTGLVLCVPRRVRWLGLAVLAMGVGTTGWLLHRERMQAVASETLMPGASEAEVVAALGPPGRVTDGSEGVEPGDRLDASGHVPGCVKQLWYAAFFFPYRQSYCFDARKRLIATRAYSSW